METECELVRPKHTALTGVNDGGPGPRDMPDGTCVESETAVELPREAEIETALVEVDEGEPGASDMPEDTCGDTL